ncbi:MAG: site-specific DNA-methyltransferase [Acidobacteria bacterium]|nr:site-specific DNA-methyltransferase [Acidobacteriota bacterium]MBA4182426.1 site-specific DNA-methyltransferase [Acidobacteriota bacterium]
MIAQNKKERAPRNRTIELSEQEVEIYRRRIIYSENNLKDCRNKIICGDAFKLLRKFPEKQFDLMFADPPYNLTKNFGENSFRQTSLEDYETWLDSWLKETIRLLKPTASIYICGDWRSSSAIQRIGLKYFTLRNRITWEREKGRGALKNWKNAAEDIWFFTVSDNFVFNLESVRTKRKVLAPYTENGKPKDWEKSDGGNYRLTAPSNLWTDLTVPFWSMSENTAHPTQKPEKLLAKIILASTNETDFILDPFSGSGTTAVVAKKLNRDFIGIEADENYCLLTEKRLALAENDKTIQGFSDGIFWERNSLKFVSGKGAKSAKKD